MNRQTKTPAAPGDAGRPRERLLAHGPRILTDAELLAIVLRTGTRGCDAVALGGQLLTRFGGLRPLLAADTEQLLAIPGLGNAKVCELQAINELKRRALAEELKTGIMLNNPQRVREFCISCIGDCRVEHCIVLFLDTQLRLIANEEVSRGTLNQASVYPREIVKSALRHHAAAIILAHNHPSGMAEPSAADIHLTTHLKKALALVDIRLLDHLVVTANHVTSLAERGQM